MLGLPVRPRSPAPAEQSPEAHSASGWATRAQRGTVRTVAPSRLRRSAVLVSARLDGQPLFFGWGANLSRAEKERVKERVALVGLSGLLALIIFLVGGALLWDKVIYAQQPMVRVDGQTVATLRQYTDVLSYRTNLLFAEYQQMQQLAGSGQGENNPLAAYAFQRLNQLQGQILGLQEGLLDEFAEDVLVRREAAKRQIAVTPEEIDAEIKRLIGYQDPNVTAAAPVGQETVAETTPAASATTDSATTDSATTDSATTDSATTDSAASTSAASTQSTATTGRRTNDFQAQYRSFLRVMGGTDALVRRDVEMQLLRRKLNEQFAQAVPTHAEQIRARHILVPDETAAKAVEERLKNGESFEALAAELSIDTSNKDEGGDLGWFARGVMVSEFEDAAFTLQPGQTSGPVKTQFGVHIIQVDERDANRELEPQQLEAFKARALDRWLETAMKEHKIERFFDPKKLEWARRNGHEPRAGSREI